MKLFVKLVLLTALIALPLAAVSAQDAPAAQTPDEVCASSVPAADPASRQFAAAEQVLEAGVDYLAIMCTSAGAITIDLLEDIVPVTVNNFVFLAQSGYYNNTTFHRVIENFMAQGGDPTATGTGDPGYAFEDEFVGFLHFDVPGWLAMANSGPNTNGSQFFITTVPTPHLDYQHTIFGEVLDGQANVAAIELRDPATSTTPGTTLDTVVIVTDPAALATAYQAPAPATEAELEATVAQIAAEVPAPLAVEAEQSGVFSETIAIASAPEAAREAFGQALTDNGFAFRAQISVANTACDLNSAPYTLLRYTIDAFGSPEAAAAVLDSGIYATTAEADGYAVSPDFTALGNAIYTRSVTACETEAIDAVAEWQRGEYVITVRATFPATNAQYTNLYLTDLMGQIFERYFTAALRAQLR